MSKESPACAALIYGPEEHLVDHLAPLCEMMHMPLIVTEEEIARLVDKYYPNVDVILCDYLIVAQQLVKNFDIIFYSMPRDLFDEVFFFAQKLFRKKVHTIWCPHGNSDKGHQIVFMEALKKEEVALVYGQKMIAFMKNKQAFDQLKAYVELGNYRYTFYKQNSAFYEQIVAKEIRGKLAPAEKQILYAPTWQDYEKSSSFFQATAHLIEQLPEKHNLIIKLHPNLLKQELLKTQILIEKYQHNPSVLFLSDFPLIYPLLQMIDIYIGDMSSIGYDFLTFDKPMFFLNQNRRDPETDPGLYLFRCGVAIEPQDYSKIYRIIEDFFQFETRDYSQTRKEVYEYTFGKEKDWPLLRHEIAKSFEVFKNDE